MLVSARHIFVYAFLTPLPPPSLALLSEKQRQNALEKMLETMKEDEYILQQVLELSNGLQRPHQVGCEPVSMFGIAMKS